MFEETELWEFIDGTSQQPILGATITPAQQGKATVIVQQADIEACNKKNHQALGIIHCHVKEAPMIHIACCTTAEPPWTTLREIYQVIGSGAITLLCNKFTGLQMQEDEDLEEHIQSLRKIFD
ncbi:hypothetical protein FS749_011911 [Ceratobasidium sp. UAMH 11750]|nr:hypothetical protein FS749_011911 [Ceratobasidium sp. UAMH 11750]